MPSAFAAGFLNATFGFASASRRIRTRALKWTRSCAGSSGFGWTIERSSALTTISPTPPGDATAWRCSVAGWLRKNLNGSRNDSSSIAATWKPGHRTLATSAKASVPITPGSTGTPSIWWSKRNGCSFGSRVVSTDRPP